MKTNKRLLIVLMVVISFLAIGAVSAADSDNMTDTMELSVVDDEVQTLETDQNQDIAEISAENDEEASAVSVASDAPLSENEGSNVSEITIYSGDKMVSKFNFTNANGTYDFSEIMQMLNQSGLNMSNFGDFADMFTNFNFTGQNKTFDFQIDGDINEVQYRLGILSKPEKFVFDYFVKSPNMNSDFNNITTTDLSVYCDGKFLTNITFNANALSMEELMKMFNMTSFDNLNIKDMMSQFNFQDMAAQFGNSTFSNDTNKTFDFKIDGEVGNIKYDLITRSNATAFVFDYKIRFKQLEVTIDANDLKVTTVNTAVDGKIGEYLTVTLKDQYGRALTNKSVKITLDSQVYDLTTDTDGKVKLQINIEKAGTYSAVIAFMGDNSCAGQFKIVKVTVKKQTAKLTVAKKKYKAKAKTKKYAATFKSAKGNAIKGKKITFKVKGKTYAAKTNAKGVATIKVKLNKKGTYKVTAKFAGDDTYNAVSKKGKIILK